MSEANREKYKQGKDWLQVDARILGQILAAQNILFVLPNETRIAEYFSQALSSVPGISSCFVCLGNKSAPIGVFHNTCRECPALQKKTDATILPGSFSCGLAARQDMRVLRLGTNEQTFGFFIFQTDSSNTFEPYWPFLSNLANYVALSLENRMQKQLLEKSHDEMENRVKERTHELYSVNTLLEEEIEIRKSIEKELQQNEEQFRFLFETMAQGIIVQDTESKILDANDAACEILGLSRDQMLEKTAYDPRWKLIHEDGSSLYPEEMPSNIALRTCKPVVDVLIGVYIPEKEIYHWILTSSIPKFKYGHNKPYLTMTTFTNITERKQAEESQEKERKRMEILLSALNTGLSLINPDMTIAWVNQKIHGMFPGREAVGQVCHVFYESRATICDGCGTVQAFLSGKVIESEQLVPGTGRWYNIISLPIKDVAGRVVNVLEGITDITERKQAEQKLKLLNFALNNVYEEAYLINEKACFDYINDESCDVLGYSREELLTMNVADIDPDFPLKRWKEHWNEIKKQGSLVFEGRHKAKDGRIYPVEISANYFEYNGQGYNLALARNITERRRMEDALFFVAQRGWQTSSENFFDALAQFLGEKLDMDYVLIDRLDENPDMAETVALYAKGTITPNMRYVLKGTPCENVMGRRLCVYPHGIQQLFPEDTLLPEMGAESYIGIPLWNSTGQAIGLIAVMSCRPISNEASVTQLLQLVATRAAAELERKQAEEEISTLNQELEKRVAERTSQLETANKELEAFSYSVSHDLRAPLRSIDGFSQVLLEEYQNKVDAQGKDYLQRVRSASQRMGQLIDDMLNLARVSRSTINIQQVNLSEMFKEIADRHIGNEPERQVEFIIKDRVKAQGDNHLLRIVLENLIGNAWKFTSNHPTARIEFGAQTLNNTPVYFVHDDGAGFNMKYAQKLFGPFQRLHTTEEFPGTGIGLATVQRIIHRHGGKVWAEGEEENLPLGKEGGATFYFTLQVDT